MNEPRANHESMYKLHLNTWSTLSTVQAASAAYLRAKYLQKGKKDKKTLIQYNVA